MTKSENPMFDKKSYLVIGKLEPGKTRTAIAPAGWCEVKGSQGGDDRGSPEGRAERPHLLRAEGRAGCAPTA